MALPAPPILPDITAAEHIVSHVKSQPWFVLVQWGSMEPLYTLPRVALSGIASDSYRLQGIVEVYILYSISMYIII